MKNKNKISIKQVKGTKKFLATFFFFFWLFIFVLLLFGPILKYRKNKSAKGSYELLSCALHPKALLPRCSKLLPIFPGERSYFSLLGQLGPLGYRSPNISRAMPQ